VRSLLYRRGAAVRNFGAPIRDLLNPPAFGGVYRYLSLLLFGKLLFTEVSGMTRNTYVLIATLALRRCCWGVRAFQAIRRLRPVQNVSLARWPHAAAIVIGVIVLFRRAACIDLAWAVSVAITGLIGVYQRGSNE